MKTSKPTSRFSFLPRLNARINWVLVVATLVCGAIVQAQDQNAKHTVANPTSGFTNQPAAAAALPAAAPSVQNSVSNPPPAEALSPLTRAVVQMADAGVSTAVIKTYVECNPSAEPLTGADIIALKQHQVADEVVTTLLTQSAKTRALRAQQKNEAVARALAARRSTSGGLDPESYDYFQYYYLQPRALASVYQRLSPYYGPWRAYPYGPPPGFGFRHYGYGPHRY